MKALVSFSVISVINGFACFVLLYWILKWSYSDALIPSVSIAVGGFVVDYLMKYTNSRKRNRTKEF